MWNDFKAFIMRGNVMDLAVGVIIGAAFGAIVKSLVDDVIMPPIGLALGNVDFSNMYSLLKAGPKAPPPYASLADAKAAGAVTLNYGLFLSNVITFLIIAAAVFVIVRMVSKLYSKPAPVTPSSKPCPYCKMEVKKDAVRCAYCTSELAA